MSEYDDIIHLPHHVSENRPHMSNLQRAAQFSAFAALKGFDEEIAETARYTEAGRTLSEEKEGEIAEKLAMLQEGGQAEVLYFAPDLKKTGGAYHEKRGRVKKVADGAILFADGTRIPFAYIVELEVL